jgi:translation initiation factor 2B subunit (eIF-2B alpha/beta/delta family)
MEMEPQFAASSLARLLKEGRLVTLVGSGASARHEDDHGRQYAGLPTPSEFVAKVRQLRTYIPEHSDFETACALIVEHESRIAVEQAIKQEFEIARPRELPPAQRVLAWLPFGAYFTSNYDQLLEWALEQEGRRPAVVIDNSDLARLSREAVPVVKYHGCVTRPRSMVATSRDYVSFADRNSLVRDLMKVTLASSNLLVIGHGLGDSDLEKIIQDLLEGLGEDYLPVIYVVREPSRRGRDLDVGYNYVDIFEDLTHFLNRLLNAYRSVDRADIAYAVVLHEEWLKSAFFTSIRRISVLPTETQVIDAFLEHLADEFSARTDVRGVTDEANSAVLQALDERPNYEALTNAWRRLRGELEGLSDPADAEMLVREEIEVRVAKTPLFARIGLNHVKRNERVLLYSQSQRVLQALKGVPVQAQRTIDLFIAECRPKSPNPYDDATAIARSLADTYYGITVCPDVVAINLMESGQITKILMGTHAVFTIDGRPHAFVNTSGSLAIAIAAERFGIEMIVIAEEAKLKEVPPDSTADEVRQSFEENLLTVASGIADLRSLRRPVEHLNIGYDLVPIGPGIHVEVADAVDRP